MALSTHNGTGSPTPVGSILDPHEKLRDSTSFNDETNEKSHISDGETVHDEPVLSGAGEKDSPDVKDGESPAEDDLVYPGGIALGMIVVALALSIFLVALDMTIVATAIPKITDEFQGADLVGWYGAAFFLTLAAFQAMWGKLYKFFPLKISFLTSIFIFELGSLICGVSPNSTALIVGRAIAGAGGAGIASGAYTIIAFAVKPNLRGAFTGIMGAAYGVASVVGPLLGGVFAENTTWRWCFYINLPIGGASAAVIFFFFRTPPNAKPIVAPLKEKILQMDISGSAIIVGGVTAYVLAFQWGGITKAWSDGSVIGALVGFGVCLILFVINEWYLGERAMVPGRLLKNRTISVAMGFIFLLGGGFFLLLYYVPLYFQVIQGVNASQSGVRNLPLIIAVTISTIISGGLVTVFGHFVPIYIVGGILATIGTGLIYSFDIGTPSSQWIGYQALAGLGIGFAFQIPIISAQATVDPSDISSATAMVLFVQTIGGAFYVSAGQTAYQNVLLQKLAINVPSIDAQSIINVGTTEIRSYFPAEDIPGILQSYMDGLRVAYAIAIASTGLAIFIALASKWPWINLKGKVQAGGAA